MDSIQGIDSRLKETQKISKDLEKFAGSLESNMTPRYIEDSKMVCNLWQGLHFV